MGQAARALEADDPVTIAGGHALPGHDALTLKAWADRLEAAAGRARELVDEEIFRTWRVYMAAAGRGFENGSLDVPELPVVVHLRAAAGVVPGAHWSGWPVFWV